MVVMVLTLLHIEAVAVVARQQQALMAQQLATAAMERHQALVVLQ
jgi:hypothetical protein